MSSTPPRWLQVGRLRFLLHGADLRYVARDGRELLRRLYVAVRDESWATLEPETTRVAVDASAERLEVHAAAHHTSKAAALNWTIHASIDAGGSLTYEVELETEEHFDYMRMGLCLLLPPATVTGRPFLAATPQGEVAGTIGSLIAPQVCVAGEPTPMFPSFSSLQLDLGPGPGRLELHFEGDLFEMEDQRNWSDGSLKVYGTPLSEPRPRRAEPGRPVRQRIELAATEGRGVSRAERPTAVTIEVEAGGSGARVPGLGTALSPAGEVSEPDGKRLRGLGLEHLRVDLRDPATAAKELERGAELAVAAGAELAVAIYPTDDAAVSELRDVLGPRTAAGIARLLVFSPREPLTPAPLLAAARRELAPLLPGASLVGGTDLWFVELNRDSLNPTAMDGLAWPVSPQVHCFDDLTMIEALEPQADQVATARALTPDLDLHVGPVTLRPRFNAAAGDAWAQALVPPPASIDQRQDSLFAAAWTAASLAQLAGAGVGTLTYFEAVGPRSALATTGTEVLPCWHPLADAGKWRGWEVLPARSSESLAAQALVVRNPEGGAIGVLVANLRPEPAAIRLAGLPVAAARVRTLDDASRGPACVDPAGFRDANGEQVRTTGGAVHLELGPYAVATLTTS